MAEGLVQKWKNKSGNEVERLNAEDNAVSSRSEESKEPNYVERAEKQAADDTASREAKDKAAAAKDAAEARRKWDESHGKNAGEHGTMWNKLFK